MVLNENELHLLCDKLDLKNNQGIYLLNGNLASGKTTLVKEMVRYLGCNSLVTSPTYLLSHCYDDKIFHYDVYRRDISELLFLGLLDEIEKDGWHFIEWGEGLVGVLREIGISYTVINIENMDNIREYIVCIN